MDEKTARALQAQAVRRMAEQHSEIGPRLAAIEAALAEVLALLRAEAAPRTTPKKGS